MAPFIRHGYALMCTKVEAYTHHLAGCADSACFCIFNNGFKGDAFGPYTRNARAHADFLVQVYRRLVGNVHIRDDHAQVKKILAVKQA